MVILNQSPLGHGISQTYTVLRKVIIEINLKENTIGIEWNVGNNIYKHKTKWNNNILKEEDNNDNDNDNSNNNNNNNNKEFI